MTDRQKQKPGIGEFLVIVWCEFGTGAKMRLFFFVFEDHALRLSTHTKFLKLQILLNIKTQNYSVFIMEWFSGGKIVCKQRLSLILRACVENTSKKSVKYITYRPM